MLTSNSDMKTILLIPSLALMLVLNALAQERPPAQILPGLAPPPIPVPVEPEEGFPEPMPFEVEEGFAGGGMFMPDMPGRFQIISAQIRQNGKAVPIVRKLDTQTGQAWHVKSITATMFRNGKPHPFTRLTFEPVDEGDHPQPLPRAEPGDDHGEIERINRPDIGIEGTVPRARETETPRPFRDRSRPSRPAPTDG